MKNLLITLSLLFSTIFSAQTHVGGGIYTNTTWLKANSPYIVDSLLVTFPGVKLTIQPGVKIKLKKDVMMEIRQGTLSIMGTVNDSIWFTSDSTAPYAGVWKGVYLNNSVLEPVSYVNMAYAYIGFDGNTATAIQTQAKNSTFRDNNQGIRLGINSAESCIFLNNTIGIEGAAFINNCSFLKNYAGAKNSTGIIQNSYFENYGTGIQNFYGTVIRKCVFTKNSGGVTGLTVQGSIIDSCSFKKNDYGLASVINTTLTNNTIDSNNVGIWMMGGNYIENNSICYNGQGIKEAAGTGNTIINNTFMFDSIGLNVLIPWDLIRCNKICNNSAYNLRYTGSSNTHLPYAGENLWCSSDSATIATSIYDGYDNVSSGLVNFTPLDASSCYFSVGIPHYDNAFAFSVFPNPSNGKFTIKFPEYVKGVLCIRDVSGAFVYNSTHSSSNELNITLNVAPGIYLVEFKGETFLAHQKIIVSD